MGALISCRLGRPQLKIQFSSLFVIMIFISSGLGCAQKEVKRGLPETTRVGIGSSIGIHDGALITHDIEEPAKADRFVSDKVVIVECPACNQRVDVTGLPRDKIRCPSCNSLFTY